MSENLKRAESLFNRIMGQNGSQTQFKLSVHSSAGTHTHNGHRDGHGHSGAKDTHSHGHRDSHHGREHHQNRRYKQELLNHQALKLPQQVLADLAGANEHILPFCWTVWFHLRYRKKENADDKLNYLKRTRDLEFPKFGSLEHTKYVASVEQMWLTLATLRRASELTIGTEFFVFKAGINPAWEDPFNTRGGRWIFKFSRRFLDNEASVEKVRIRSGLIWERLLLRLMGGTLIGLDYSDDVVQMMLSDINGIVLSVRKDEDIISLWNSNLNYRNNKKVTNFQGKRILCDSILRVIRECDSILAGADAISTVSNNSNDRVKGVLFEYRLHADYNNDEKFKGSRNRKEPHSSTMKEDSSESNVNEELSSADERHKE